MSGSDSKSHGHGFHLHLHQFNTAYKGFDATHDAVRDDASDIMKKSAGLDSSKIGGRVGGVTSGAHAGLARLRGSDPDSVHGALRALQYRNAHLLNGMYDSLEAYNQADDHHSKGISESGTAKDRTITGKDSDPGKSQMGGPSPNTQEHEKLPGSN